MFVCAVCGADDSREELVDEVFNVDGRHIMVESVPCTICTHCGDQSFSRETAEKVRLMLHGEARPTRSVSMQVYEFAF